MKKPIALFGYDDEHTKIEFTVPRRNRKPATIAVPRFDYIPEDKFATIMAELNDLDIQQQITQVAGDLAGSPLGTECVTEPLLDGTRKRLTDLGVTVTRDMKQGISRDVVIASTQESLDAVAGLALSDAERPMQLRRYSRMMALTMLKHVVSDEEITWLEELPAGALSKLLEEWKAGSSITLGE